MQITYIHIKSLDTAIITFILCPSLVCVRIIKSAIDLIEIKCYTSFH